MRPRIGITSNVALNDRAVAHAHCYVNAAYVDAVFAAGGTPLVLPPPPTSDPDALDALLAACDAVLFTGGADLNPRHYGQTPHPATCALPDRRDRFEVEFFRRSERRGLPVLAICLGCQVANVARGGSLVQHIDELPRPSPVEHHRPDETSAFHDVAIVPDSLLARVVGATRIEVNSRHHQVVSADQLGGALRPVAFAPDGVVEAAEDRARPFMLAVQWHPEDLIDRPEHLRLFEALVDAAGRARR